MKGGLGRGRMMSKGNGGDGYDCDMSEEGRGDHWENRG